MKRISYLFIFIVLFSISLNSKINKFFLNKGLCEVRVLDSQEDGAVDSVSISIKQYLVKLNKKDSNGLFSEIDLSDKNIFVNIKNDLVNIKYQEPWLLNTALLLNAFPSKALLYRI